MLNTEVEFLEEENCKEEKKSYWTINRWYPILTFISLGIPLLAILFNLIPIAQWLGIKTNIGIGLGNSISLFAAGGAITGTLYSNYKNELRSEKQICEAGNRLTKQINNQNINLEKQMIEADNRMNKQIVGDTKQDAVFSFAKKIMDIFNYPCDDIEIKQNVSLIDEITAKTHFDINIRGKMYYNNKEILNDPKQFNYLSPDLKKEIKKYNDAYFKIIKNKTKFLRSNVDDSILKSFYNPDEYKRLLDKNTNVILGFKVITNDPYKFENTLMGNFLIINTLIPPRESTAITQERIDEISRYKYENVIINDIDEAEKLNKTMYNIYMHAKENIQEFNFE
jgi:hypothetical protein